MMQRRIGEYLFDASMVTEDQVKQALAIQANAMHGGRVPLLGTILVERFSLNERALEKALEDQERERVGFVRDPVPEQPHSAPREGNGGPS